MAGDSAQGWRRLLGLGTTPHVAPLCVPPLQKDTDEEVREFLNNNLHLQDKVRWLVPTSVFSLFLPCHLPRPRGPHGHHGPYVPTLSVPPHPHGHHGHRMPLHVPMAFTAPVVPWPPHAAPRPHGHHVPAVSPG